MSGRTWKNVEASTAEEVKKYLIDNGANEQDVKSPHEEWRVRFSDSTFTFYKKGTLYATPSSSSDPAVSTAWKHFDALIGSSYVLPSKDFLIGLDETGKGEVIGHTVLSGVIFPKGVFKDIDLMAGPADTKKRHRFKYWDKLFRGIDRFRESGFDFVTEKIPPWHVDKYNLNKIMDVVYQRILSIFLRRTQIKQCRIVLDDYGIGATLKRFLNFLTKQGAELVVTHNAEDMYLEAKIASLTSKRAREMVIKRINENLGFQVEGCSVGTGNAGDPRTITWLKKWYKSGKEWPWFVKRSFRTIKDIEGRLKKIKKVTPPIREEILAKKFLDEFNKGKLSTKSLSIVCPHCGGIHKAVTFAIFKQANKKVSGMKCPSCNRLIDYAGITLRYYCGYVVPDSSAIYRSLMSRDLESSRFFEDFTIVVPAVVRKECESGSKGRSEFERLAKFASMGRIRLEYEGKLTDIPSDLTSAQRDEIVTDAALTDNAILITADNTMKSHAMAKNIFTIFI